MEHNVFMKLHPNSLAIIMFPSSCVPLFLLELMRSKYKRRFQCFLRNLYRNHVALIFCFSIFVHALWCLFSYKDFQNSSASSKGCHDFTCYLHTGFNASCIEFNDSFLLLSVETKLSTLELSAALGTSKGSCANHFKAISASKNKGAVGRQHKQTK